MTASRPLLPVQSCWPFEAARRRRGRLGAGFKKQLPCIWLLVLAFFANAEVVHGLTVIPLPANLHKETGVFRITPETPVKSDGQARAEAAKLVDLLTPTLGFRLKLTNGATREGAVDLELNPALKVELGSEGYSLKVAPNGITLLAVEPAGLFYGIQTLRQLLSDGQVPCVTITDSPRFGWRGLLIDPARHFIPVEDVKHVVDAMALHKFNRLQIHLTDNEGWRIEIKKYPKLTELGSQMDWTCARDRSDTPGHTGFYTQEDIRELVRYAAERHITIVPEIEMPYHAGSAIVAYPEHGVNTSPLADQPPAERWKKTRGLLGPRPGTVAFMQDILTEVMDLFPSRHIHIGGDEAKLQLWAEDPEMQAQMKRLGCEDAHALHSWFIKQMDAFLTRHGRRMVGWDEILQGGLAPGATVMSWRGTAGGIAAAKAGHDVVMAPTSHTYFDYRQAPDELGLGKSVIDLRKVYQFEPVPPELNREEAGRVLGGQAQLWGELISDADRRDFMTWPRACVLAEKLWSQKADRSFRSFLVRLVEHRERLDRAGIRYRPLDPELIEYATAPTDQFDYPGEAPGIAEGSAAKGRLELGNRVIHGAWQTDRDRVGSLTVKSLYPGGRVILLENGHLPRVVLGDGRIIDLANRVPARLVRPETMQPVPNGLPTETRYPGRRLSAAFQDEKSGLSLVWSVELRDGSNVLVQSLELTAAKDVKIHELVFVDGTIEGAEQVGQVDGSVVVTGNLFMAVEHPLAKNTVGDGGHVRCALPRGHTLEAGRTWRFTSVFGVTPPHQRRRGFLYYLERRRAHPYRPFLHYNSWYHLNIGRPNNHMTEAECLETVAHFGRELIDKRGAKMDAFVWDDGWDDFNSLWGFHGDFPNGFKKLDRAARALGAAQGVWMSPWGGYGQPKKKRIAYGEAQGFETNKRGFSMAGPKYWAAFRGVGLNMMREHGVRFFKFDGMGAGGGTGASGELGADVDAVLRLAGELRKEQPDLFISATVGTWASPFWTFHADSIWRQGGDTGFHGPGNNRRRWITYRDMFCFQRIVEWGPLYPISSLMLHGPCIGERANPAKMPRDEASVAEEIWSFFGSGVNLQELYISPHLLTPKMWDELAAAANWSRAHADVLADTHWIGGDPGLGEVYGWASWQPRKGIVALRNPSDKSQSYELVLAAALELPDPHLTDYVLKPVRPDRNDEPVPVASVEPHRIEMRPFEVRLFEAEAVAGAELHDAQAYRKRLAQKTAVERKENTDGK